jgi:hypothetical protein
MPKQPKPYVPRGPHTLDDIDWSHPGIIADIRRVFAVLEEYAAEKAKRHADTAQILTGEEAAQAFIEALKDERPANEEAAQEARKPL